jgi:hypothetical protein
VQLLKSIFCYPGFDNRLRFLVIIFSCHLIILASNSVLAQFVYSNIFILLCLALVIVLTTCRRLNDAQLKRIWSVGPASLFVIIGLITIITNDSNTNWLLILPIILSLLLMTYPNKAKTDYILGYSGPIDLSEFDYTRVNKQKRNQRIEPIIITDLQNPNTPIINANLNKQKLQSSETVLSNSLINSTTSKYDNNEQDIGVLIRLKLLSNKSIKLTLIILSLLIILTFTVSYLISSISNNYEEIEPTTKPKIEIMRTDRVSFPDNFSLLLSQHHGLIINWQADSSDNEKIWELQNAQGDKSCKEVTFNNGKKIRTTDVVAEDREQYFANFSPLDTESLLQEIAFRGYFTLCGYKFSLKGSQAILGKHIEYARMVAY